MHQYPEKVTRDDGNIKRQLTEPAKTVPRPVTTPVASNSMRSRLTSERQQPPHLSLASILPLDPLPFGKASPTISPPTIPCTKSTCAGSGNPAQPTSAARDQLTPPIFTEPGVGTQITNNVPANTEPQIIQPQIQDSTNTIPSPLT